MPRRAQAVASLVLLLTVVGCGPSEHADLTEACGAPGATLASARAPIGNASLAHQGQALVYQLSAERYALLEMPDCRVTPLPDVRERVGLSDVFVLVGGTRLFSTLQPGSPDVQWWYARGTQAAPERLAFLPDPQNPFAPAPILSNDGDWVAWPRSVRDRDGFHVEIAMRHPDGQPEAVVRLTSLEPDTYELLELDTATRDITLAHRLKEFLRVGFDGRVRWRVTPDDINAQRGTFVRLAEGYFAWDAIRESGPYRIVWSRPPGNDTLAFERLREIHHAAIDPTGRFAGVSLETQYGRLLALADSVTVVRLSDRREVFRKYLPRFTRTNVAFLTAGYFAYDDANRIHVLRLPP